MNIATPRILATILCMLGVPLSQAQTASSGGAELAPLASKTNAAVYSCDLRGQFNQCRQFAVDPQQAIVRLSQVEESCQSLGGRFAPLACPTEAVVARCEEVKFRRDFVYENFYYAGDPSQWTPQGLEYACAHLPGKYRAASSLVSGEKPQH